MHSRPRDQAPRERLVKGVAYPVRAYVRARAREEKAGSVSGCDQAPPLWRSRGGGYAVSLACVGVGRSVGGWA
jgi:hypothetical protein